LSASKFWENGSNTLPLWLPAAPDVLQEPVLRPQVGEPGLRVFRGAAGAVAVDVGKGAPHSRRYGVGVAAHEDRRPLLNQLPDFVLVGQHLVLDVAAPVHGLAGKHGVQAHHPAFLEIAQLVFVNVVLRVAAAEEQH